MDLAKIVNEIVNKIKKIIFFMIFPLKKLGVASIYKDLINFLLIFNVRVHSSEEKFEEQLEIKTFGDREVDKKHHFKRSHEG